MSYARIDELEEITKRQGRSIGISSPASYFAAAAERDLEIEDVGTVNTAKETNRTTEQKNTNTTFLAKTENEHQIEMPNKDEGTMKAFVAQNNYDAMLNQFFHLT